MITNLSLYFSPTYAHIKVDGKAINCTINSAIITELESSPRFKHLRKLTDELFAKYPDKKITFTGHSLGGAMIYYLYKQLGDKIKGDVFNPAINLEVLRSIVPRTIKSHIIEGDAVSDFLGKLMVNKQVYNNPYGMNTDIAHNIRSHRLR